MIVTCPHCKYPIEILAINCAIFRHAVLKVDFAQINPHLQKDQCMELIEKDLIYGCGYPFKIVEENNVAIAVVCDFI